jgi:hypothetical protein
MKQSVANSAKETLLDVGIGFAISLVAQIYFLAILDVPITLEKNVKFAVIMTLVSLARKFLVRRFFEWLHIRERISPALAAIVAERRRQVEAECYDSEHDDRHRHGELARAGAAYALNAASGGLEGNPPAFWPWGAGYWNPKDVRRDLIRAGALILAELERLERYRKLRTWPTEGWQHYEKAKAIADTPGDELARFLKECTIEEEGESTSAADLYRRFLAWRGVTRVGPDLPTFMAFNVSVAERGYVSPRGRAFRAWRNMKLCASPVPALAHGKTPSEHGGGSV